MENKILNNFLKHSHCDNIIKDLFGINAAATYDLIMVAPNWEIHKLFDLSNKNIVNIGTGKHATAYEIKVGIKTAMYVSLQVGAPNMIDFCVCLMQNIKCEKFLFVGSAGALTTKHKLGDIIIPEYSFSGDGASLYLYETLSKDNFLKKAFSNKEFSLNLSSYLKYQKYNVFNSPVVTMDSITCEYSHLNFFKQLGAEVIEMESATFFNVMNLFNKQHAALLIVSDNSATDSALITSDDNEKQSYYNVRKTLGEQIINYIESNI